MTRPRCWVPRGVLRLIRTSGNLAMSSGIPNPGHTVVFSEVPPALIDGLPEEDQQAILDAVGKPVLFNEIDEYGRAELEFMDRKGIIHFIWLDPNAIMRAD